MSIPFAKIPANVRVPLFYAEIDPSRANTAQVVQRTLIIGQKTSAGTGVANIPVRSQSAVEAKTIGGAGSMLAALTAIYRQNDSFGEVWYLPLADDAGATAAAGSIAFTGPTTGAGTLQLYIAGTLLAVPISSGMTAAQVATAVVAAITATPDLLVNAAVNGSTASQVDVTAKNKGLVGNDTPLVLNFLGASAGEVLPAGLGATITALSGGATNPSLTTGLSNLQDMGFDFIISPYTDATSVGAITALLNDTTGRWAWSSQIYGHAYIGYRGTSGALTTFGAGLNDPHLSVIGVYNSPKPAYLWAAAFAAAAAVSLRIDPALPLQTLTVQGLIAPPLESRFALPVRNTLLYTGISTYTVDPAGGIAIENMITTYLTNASGQPDNSFLEIETMYNLAFVLRRLKAIVTGKFARKKLAADGTRPAPGSAIVTPSTIRSELIAGYRQLEAEGYVQQSDVFATNLVVEKSATTPGRVDVLWPGILIEQLRVFALLAQFRTF